MNSFFSELKRRNVYKVAVAYAVVAWLLIQIATQTFPFFEVPNWAVRLVIIVLVIGFPIALVIAWAFELTPEGIARTESAAPTGERIRRGHAWIYVVAVAGLLSFALFFLGRYTASRTTSAEEGGSRNAASLPAKSVAVLPFENLSEDKANAYFVDGIQDEVITRLAKIGDLRVISRTSTLRYRTRASSLAEIARELGVSHLLEGTVQRIGDRVRINVQLVRAANEDHLWAEIYDRNLTDIFAVQSELATAIARSLQAKLTGREQEAVTEKPTTNLAAYDAYLRGIDFSSRPGERPNEERNAAEAFAQAVRLDPQFAQAWARFSEASASLYFLQFDGTEARAELARSAVENAKRLAPASPETLMAEAYYRYHVKRDFTGARELFEKLRRDMPSSSDAVEALARIARRQNRWLDSIRLFEEAEKLNPRDASLFMDRCWTFSMVRNYPATLQMLERAEAIAPEDPEILQNKAYYFQWIGDLKAAEGVMERIDNSPKHGDIAVTQRVLERRFDEAATKVEEMIAHPEGTDEVDRATIKEWLGSIRFYAGDVDAAKKIYLEVKPVLEKLQREQPINRWLVNSLSTVEAGLGDKAAALRLAEQAWQDALKTGDPIAGPVLEENLASTEARVGEEERAITRIERLLTIPYGAFPLTVARLRLDPVWDPLRSHPRFKAIVEGPEPKTFYQ
ncbi:MAG: hypothetical protein ACJ8NS_13615 [Chthoniobacterales bacterium]